MIFWTLVAHCKGLRLYLVAEKVKEKKNVALESIILLFGI